ncbi:serine protease [Leptospira wolffii]|uniref:S1C family serine protease n=1 Tax=Leptospira wolffii TaxID=409998 RepID=UPI0010845FFB|nr:serine protease [Leptospira wolffii]TGK71186.1 serine protease [Leptospira wolffii]TGK77754.1 serine protease [Leptospira wolffii]TGL29536.1 serine protease [Leptospira wolffii]
MLQRIVSLALILVSFSVIEAKKKPKPSSPPKADHSVISKSEEEFKKSIVQVKISYQEPDYFNPWKKKNPRVRRGVGIVVPGERILLPAHLLAYSTLVEVKKFSSYAETKAIISKIDSETDLALLKVEEEGFYKDLTPLEFHSSISYPKQVSIYQLDNSGSIQSSSGSLISLDLDQYPQGLVELPVLDVNSAETLNGNGEVLLENGNVTGILFEFSGDKNSGRAIPSFLIQKFLGKFGKSEIAFKGFRYRPVTDQATKNFYGITEKDRGIVVAEVLPGSSADGVLQPGDVILEFGGKKIDSKGYFEHPKYGKQVLSYIAHSGDEFGYQIGKEIPVSILRDKKPLEIKLPLKPFPYSAIRIPHRNPGLKTDYYFNGGFLFVELSEGYLLEWGKDWRSKVDRKLLYLYDYNKFSSPGKEGKIVILSQVIPDESNNGYHEVGGRIVESVNGKPIRSVKDIAKQVKESGTRFVEVRLDDGTDVVLDKENLSSANKRIQTEYRIPNGAMGER